VEDKVKFYEGNLFDVDFSEATVLTLYLLPDVNLKLKPKILSEMKPGSRVVSHAFNMGDWKPDGQISVDGRSVFLWIIPEKKNDSLFSLLYLHLCSAALSYCGGVKAVV